MQGCDLVFDGLLFRQSRPGKIFTFAPDGEFGPSRPFAFLALEVLDVPAVFLPVGNALGSR